jgi:hypothetical protein
LASPSASAMMRSICSVCVPVTLTIVVLLLSRSVSGRTAHLGHETSAPNSKQVLCKAPISCRIQFLAMLFANNMACISKNKVRINYVFIKMSILFRSYRCFVGRVFWSQIELFV